MITIRRRHGDVFAVVYSYATGTSAPTASARAWDVPRCTTSSTFEMVEVTKWDNLIVLCYDCHRKRHASVGRRETTRAAWNELLYKDLVDNV